MSEDVQANVVDEAVAGGGAYEIIRKRLLDQGEQLKQHVGALNTARLEEFGTSDMEVIGRVRVRTENNCVARDIVQVGEFLLFGYNVFIGLKKETKVADVFALFQMQEGDNGYEIQAIPMDKTFLDERSFVNDFDELYRYYKHTRLTEITIREGKLLAGFQIGEKLDDVRVFRWSISPDGKDVKYIDNRGERDIRLPPAYDFEWIPTSRDQIVHGRHAHINILDKVFVETLNGDLTIKIENNTEDGRGIYREPVEDKTQSLDDVEVAYAEVSGLIVIKVLPYRESDWRYLIYNPLIEKVVRVDAIGESCVQLPEDHGLVYPGGYYLSTGEYKRYDEKTAGLKFKRMLRSPNGEDVLYVFYDPIDGVIALLGYNLIEKSLQNPIYGHGYALAANGRVVIFSAEAEPTRIHPMQIWRTPYQSAEFAAKTPASQSFYGRIGNAELVRGISDLYSICRMVDNQSVSSRLYEELSQSASKLFDAYYWLDEVETKNIANLLREINSTAELVIDEFEKVQSIRQQSAQTMAKAESEQEAIIREIRVHSGESAQEFTHTLGRIRKQLGHLTTIRDYRYIDTHRITQLEIQMREEEGHLSEQTVNFLSQENALEPYFENIAQLEKDAETANTKATLQPFIDTIEELAQGLDLLSELMGTLKVDDATVRTRIIDSISDVYAKLNQTKAKIKNKQKNLGSEEAVAQFAAQFKLFSQSITNALGVSTTPEECDDQLSRLLVQLEELESQFSEFDQFLADIMDKREEVYESFEAHKQQLLDERQRKSQNVVDAANRIIASIEKRALKFSELDDLNTYFASDALVMKARELVEQLRELDAAVKADDVESRFKAAKEQALRSLRDKTEIYEAGGNVIKLGPRHRFSVNTQELDLTIIPKNGILHTHLIGTDFYQPIELPELLDLKHCWDLNLESESAQVYRAEYLASLVLDAAQKKQGVQMDDLRGALKDTPALTKIVREFAAPRYKEGYERGVHDHDAARLLQMLVPALDQADLLRYDPLSRALAQVFWANTIKQSKRQNGKIADAAKLSYKTWPERAQSAEQMHSVFASADAKDLLAAEVRRSMEEFVAANPLAVTPLDIRRAADYLVAELGRERTEFIGSKYATELVAELKRSVDDATWRRYQMALEKMMGWPAERWNLTNAWLTALIKDKALQRFSRYIPEAVALINSDERLERRFSQVDLELSVDNLLGDHNRLQNQSLSFSLDEFLQRLEVHKHEVLPAYHRYLDLRQEIAQKEKKSLRLDEFKPRPLSSFVRNKLINDAYLPIIGDNLAKQMGTVGENKRTDFMGLLMMISPPGYGKTTLMEYVASRLGLIFMKINCPSLGHDVLSLDPEQAPNATARQELNKLNLALEMGNNVMLYLDDIQHTNPEFLQKFISLCDGTRRIEGVWKGETKTYDMRGRKFCVVMAGNPYTESGEVFQIPDMLANRADIYNLGDILGGMDKQFALSYIENSLTSNPVLAPLATRDLADLYLFVRMAEGDNVPTTDLKHQYSGAEINEIVEVLKKLFLVQKVVLKINQQYIASAAQNDKYRTEPPFKLQGSYRNMNKMGEKISAVMNEKELQQMVEDHYLGEAQLLTSGTEDNLLKLAELRGVMTAEQKDRWEKIKRDFMRNKAIGGDDQDVGNKVVAQLVDIAEGLDSLGKSVQHRSVDNPEDDEPKAIEQRLVLPARTLKSLYRVIKSTREKSNIDELVQGFNHTLSELIDQLAQVKPHSNEDSELREAFISLNERLRKLEKSSKQQKAASTRSKNTP